MAEEIVATTEEIPTGFRRDDYPSGFWLRKGMLTVEFSATSKSWSWEHPILGADMDGCIDKEHIPDGCITPVSFAVSECRKKLYEALAELG